MNKNIFFLLIIIFSLFCFSCEDMGLLEYCQVKVENADSDHYFQFGLGTDPDLIYGDSDEVDPGDSSSYVPVPSGNYYVYQRISGSWQRINDATLRFYASEKSYKIYVNSSHDVYVYEL